MIFLPLCVNTKRLFFMGISASVCYDESRNFRGRALFNMFFGNFYHCSYAKELS